MIGAYNDDPEVVLRTCAPPRPGAGPATRGTFPSRGTSPAPFAASGLRVHHGQLASAQSSLQIPQQPFGTPLSGTSGARRLDEEFSLLSGSMGGAGGSASGGSAALGGFSPSPAGIGHAEHGSEQWSKRLPCA